jgi:hypothetical protein
MEVERNSSLHRLATYHSNKLIVIMKAAFYDSFGGPELVKVSEVDPP